MQIDVFNELHALGRLEPETNAAQTDQEITLISIAVSLKRIADALWGVDGTSGVLQLLNPLDTRNHF